MAIPNLPDLAELLSGTRLSPTKPTAGLSGIQIPFLPATDETGPISKPSLWLQYPADTKISFAKALERVNRELSAVRHPRHNDFSLFVLAIAALVPMSQGEIISRLNTILDKICDVDVNLYYVLFMDLPGEWRFDIPPFQVGPLRGDKLRYSCEKTASDFYKRYRNELQESWAIERRPRKVRVLDITAIRRMLFDNRLDRATRVPWELEAWEAIVDGYFSIQNRLLFDEFWTELISAQSPLLAAGAPYFDLSSISTLVHYMQIAIFQNIGSRKEGFVAPNGAGAPMIDFANVHKRIPTLLRELKSSYGFDEFDDTPLHRSIRLFTEFVARGRRHEIDVQPSEALLHYVIALELIFGDKQAIQKSVAERVALITFRVKGRSFLEARNVIERIYELRSKYVHAGALISDEEQLDDVRSICEEVFRCLLRLQAAHPNRASRTAEVLTLWLRKLDYLVAGLAAGVQPTDAQLTETFVG